MELLFIGILIGLIVGAIAAWTGTGLLREYQRKHNIFDFDEVVEIIKANPKWFKDILIR